MYRLLEMELEPLTPAGGKYPSNVSGNPSYDEAWLLFRLQILVCRQGKYRKGEGISGNCETENIKHKPNNFVFYQTSGDIVSPRLGAI